MESRKRSIVKAISWRVTATIITTLISFVITGSIDMAVKIGLVEVFAKMALYYLHERGWTKIRFGVSKKPVDFQI